MSSESELSRNIFHKLILKSSYSVFKRFPSSILKHLSYTYWFIIAILYETNRKLGKVTLTQRLCSQEKSQGRMDLIKVWRDRESNPGLPLAGRVLSPLSYPGRTYSQAIRETLWAYNIASSSKLWHRLLSWLHRSTSYTSKSLYVIPLLFPECYSYRLSTIYYTHTQGLH